VARATGSNCSKLSLCLSLAAASHPFVVACPEVGEVTGLLEGSTMVFALFCDEEVERRECHLLLVQNV